MKRKVLSPKMRPIDLLGAKHAKSLEKKFLFGPQGQVVSGARFVWTEDFVVKPK
jgi:hypothetical protein